jgi:deoxycytidine triphosphate deaminase
MSVLQIRGRTTKSYPDFDAASHSSNSLIFTDALEPQIETFSLELSLGNGWSDSYSVSNRNLWRIDEGITIKGHDSFVVEAAEEIRVPHNRYGIVLPTGSLFLSRGVLVASAKVEPAFDGKLKLRIYNTTSKSLYLTKGDKLGSVIFFSTESTHTHKPISRASEISTAPITRLTQVGKWFGLNKNLWLNWIVMVLCSSALASLINHYGDRVTTPPQPSPKPTQAEQTAAPATTEATKK